MSSQIALGNEQATLLFSDLTSAPNSGWSTAEPSKGAAVTVWGHNLGNQRNNNFISVGGVDLTADSDYANWGESWPTPYWQKITFWLNDSIPQGSQPITVTINGQTSNPIDFSIGEGRIFYISATGPNGDGSIDSPFLYTHANGSSGYVAGMLPGDIYYFRDGLYDSKANGGNSVLWIRESEPSGTANSPIGLIAYPSEQPVIYVESYNVNFRSGFQMSNQYMIISGFKFDSEYIAVNLSGDFLRLVGNDLVGLKAKYGSGTGIVNTAGSGSKLLGNAIHGGNSKDRFDHGSYFSGCAPIEGNHLGWNYYYDNDFGRGPLMAINHQENRCIPDVEILKAHFVFNNIADCSSQRATAINVYDLSYDIGEPEPEPTYVYNNLFLNCGTLDLSNQLNIGFAPAVIANSAHSRFYNNVIYNSEYVGFAITSNILSVRFQNNIIVMDSSSPLDGRDDKYIQDQSNGLSTISNNLLFDKGNSTTDISDIDTVANIVGQNPLFNNPASGDFTLSSNSPAIDAGTNNLLFEVSPPNYAPINRDIEYILRSSNYDIGAHEYRVDPGLVFQNSFE
ncbi:MAG: hypothetical protein ACWA5R_13695 [bacterium]